MSRRQSWIGLGVAALVAAAPAFAAGEMVLLPAGQYRPQYGSAAQKVDVASFWLDIHPVINGEFLAFVRGVPKWRRATVPPLFADESYLSHWEGDLIPGALAPAEAPVTNVSWFAAKAYCANQRKRLPTMDEWERAAATGIDQPIPADRDAFNRRILDWYSEPTRLPLPAVGYSFANHWGVWDLHGLVWEWVSDFNALMTTGASRKDAGGLDRQLFCAAGSVGSADPGDYAAFMRYAMRGSVKARYAIQNMGFRCARDGTVDQEEK